MNSNKLLISLFLVPLFLGNSLQAQKKPLKVFLLVGQSNMQGHAHVRTLEHVGMDPKTAPILKEIQDENGKAKVFDQIWISYLSAKGVKKGKLTTGFGADDNKIGPELTFGIYMQKKLGEPILIIKTAWGGKSINTDFRSPSAGSFEFRKDQIEQFKKQGKDVDQIKKKKAAATGHYYRQMIAHIKKVLANIPETYPGYDSEQGYELAGMVWFQGWNDMVDRGCYPNRDKKGGYDRYSQWLAHFIRDVRKDLNAPELPFVTGVMGAGGPTSQYKGGQKRYQGIHQNFRDAMAAPAKMKEFQGNVVNVLTENYWDMQLVGLRARQGKVNQQVRKAQKEKGLKGKAVRALREQLMAEEFSKKESEILAKAVSNAEFHYLGSAKILTQIGKGFAEALFEMAK